MTEVVKQDVKAWAVLEGPLQYEDDWEEDDPWVILVKCSAEGVEDMFDLEMYFTNFSDAYGMKSVIMMAKEPVVIGEVETFE